MATISTDRIYVTAEEIKKTNCEKAFQETSINWLRDDDKLSIDTSDNTFITKMKSLMQRDPEHYKCFYYAGNLDKKTGLVSNYIFEVDKSLLSFRVSQTRRELSEEEKRAMVERMKKNN